MQGTGFSGGCVEVHQGVSALRFCDAPPRKFGLTTTCPRLKSTQQYRAKLRLRKSSSFSQQKSERKINLVAAEGSAIVDEHDKEYESSTSNDDESHEIDANEMTSRYVHILNSINVGC